MQEPNLDNIPEELAKYKDKIKDSFTKYIRVKTNYVQIDPGLTKSKFGGVPFLLDASAYPKAKNGRDLILIAQLNFAEIPHLEDFPSDGILQFFIADDELYGLNFEHQNVQDGFRVIYHPANVVDTNKAITNYPWPKPKEYFIFDNSVALGNSAFELTFELAEAPISPVDFRFEGFLEESIWDMPKDVSNWYWALADTNSHKIGGYSFFTQDDPRIFEKKYRPYTTQLLEMNSEYDPTNKKAEIMWGDMGVANFLIKPENLKNLDFSDVMYTWDCS